MFKKKLHHHHDNLHQSRKINPYIHSFELQTCDKTKQSENYQSLKHEIINEFVTNNDITWPPILTDRNKTSFN